MSSAFVCVLDQICLCVSRCTLTHSLPLTRTHTLHTSHITHTHTRSQQAGPGPSSSVQASLSPHTKHRSENSSDTQQRNGSRGETQHGATDRERDRDKSEGRVSRGTGAVTGAKRRRSSPQGGREGSPVGPAFAPPEVVAAAASRCVVCLCLCTHTHTPGPSWTSARLQLLAASSFAHAVCSQPGGVDCVLAYSARVLVCFWWCAACWVCILTQPVC